MPLSLLMDAYIAEKRMNGQLTTFRYQGIAKGFLILAIILIIGSTGYMLIEKWNLIDSLYMTVITITTVGYGEVRSVSETGRIFTIFLIFSGIGIMAYILGMVAQAMVEVHVVRTLLGRTKLGLRIRSIKNHYIICGYGRMGKIIAKELKRNQMPILVIDNKADYKYILENENILYVIDDATSEEILIEAGIDRAKGLITVVSSDADNLFITMTARGLRSDLFILARADEEHTEKKLIRAGANKVVMPYLIGGRQMAHSIIKPAVTDFLEFAIHSKDIDLKMEELVVKEGSRLDGVSLMNSRIREDMDVIIVAIRKKDMEMRFNPSSKTRIEANDTLIAIGRENNLEKLDVVLSGRR